jgi:hypothetical protein
MSTRDWSAIHQIITGTWNFVSPLGLRGFCFDDLAIPGSAGLTGSQALNHLIRPLLSGKLIVLGRDPGAKKAWEHRDNSWGQVRRTKHNNKGNEGR